MQHRARPAPRGDHDRTAADPLGPPPGAAEGRAPEDRAQDDAHLEAREARADAAADAAAERDPAVGVGALAEEALRAERAGLGVHVSSAVREVDARRDDRS